MRPIESCPRREQSQDLESLDQKVREGKVAADAEVLEKANEEVKLASVVCNTQSNYKSFSATILEV